MVSDRVACWFCPVCRTLTRLALARANRCCQQPRRIDCPLPFRTAEAPP